jgi:hypothetical protein
LLFDSTLFNSVIGRAFYILHLFENFPIEGELQYDMEECHYYFNDPNDILNKNCINFFITAFNGSIDNRFKPLIDLTYQITGGSGKYLGATGTVNFKTDINNVRYITLDIFY